MSSALELKVFLAGRVAVEADGVLMGEERFPGRQGRLLFAYLVAEQGRPVPRDELAEALWAEAPPPATWEKALTVLVSKLRGLLADCGLDGATILTSAFGCYRLNLPEGTWVDVIAAAESLREAEAALAAARSRTGESSAPQRLRHWLGRCSCREMRGPGSMGSGVSSRTLCAARSAVSPRRAFVRTTRRRRRNGPRR